MFLTVIILDDYDLLVEMCFFIVTPKKVVCFKKNNVDNIFNPCERCKQK